ncbi:MAG: hypothetical protein E6F99_11540 [Actinobacteria bacterium]|nr:MAG: hypothetical protein E6F99_11540 [Actinomycetota bacterium]
MATELRVHGVSGSPVESLLDRPLLGQVAGDADAGFFRPLPAYGNTTGPGGATLEGYRWGNLTAGAAARALWLLLLPFMLANVALWLRPPGPGRALYRTLCRLFAASVTVTFVLAAIGVSVDLVAWQCATPGNPCGSTRTYLAFLTHGFFAPTGRRLAVLSLVPIAALAVLWYLGRRTWSRYEKYERKSDVDGDGLADPGFWRGQPLVGRLRALHVALGFGALDAVLLGVLAPHDGWVAGWLLLALAVLAVLLPLVALTLPAMVVRQDAPSWTERTAAALRTAALGLTAVVWIYAMWPRPAWPTSGGLPGYGMTITVLFAAQLLLLLVLAAVALRQHTPGQYLAGLAGPVCGSLGLAVAAAFTAGTSFQVADFLDRSASPVGRTDSARLQPPAALQWSALGMTVAVLVVLVVGLVAWRYLLPRLHAAARTVTDEDFTGGRAGDPDRATAIDNAVADARLTDHSGQLLLWGYLPLAVAALVVTVLALLGKGPVDLAPRGSWVASVVAFATGLGTYLIGLAAVGLMTLGYRAYRDQSVRRSVGVLWDLGTFWPRAAHPLAPPCYAERAVPELATRTRYLAQQGRVILSGHSQGSVLVAATVLQLPPSTVDNVALLTFGSPIRRLYARLFPAYVNQDVLTAVATGVGGRWTNLWRDTDPIGGPVGEPAHDWRFRDPAGFPIPPSDTAYPLVRGHSGYPSDPAFGAAVTELS